MTYLVYGLEESLINVVSMSTFQPSLVDQLFTDPCLIV